MAKTASILTGPDWKKSFGQVLTMAANEQEITVDDIARRLDRLPGSTGRNRAGDWSRYVNKGRIPTEAQLEALSNVLRVPLPVMRVCAGYIDDLFECVYPIISGNAPEPWGFPVDPVRASLAFLFALFPGERMHIGNRGAIERWMRDNTVRSHMTREEGFQTGEQWNAIWLYPVRSPGHLIAHHDRPDDPTVTSVWEGEPRTEPWTWYSMEALLQVDLASPVVAAILSGKRAEIPKNHLLFEAQQAMHRRLLPIGMRVRQAAEILHHWADTFNKDLAAEVREHVHPWNIRTITDDAARWVLGERIEDPDPSTLPPDTPRRIHMQFYSWDCDGRPRKFWV
jgi:transcriptional regulator with XRE-family HTH domain